MKRGKITGMLCVWIGAGLMAGCADTPESSIVKQKGQAAIENYKEAGTDTAGQSLRQRLDAPEHYSSEAADATGKLQVHTDAAVEIPDVEEVSAIYVSQHPFGQERIDEITKAIFGEGTTVYDAAGYFKKTKEEWRSELEQLKGYAAVGNLDPFRYGTDSDGNYKYDIYQEIENAENAYNNAPEKRELAELASPYRFEETEYGSIYGEGVSAVNACVELADGTYYWYGLMKREGVPMEITIQKVDGGTLSARNPVTDPYWWRYDLDSQKILDEEEFCGEIGISKEDAQKLADEKVAALNLANMEMAFWEYKYKSEAPMNHMESPVKEHIMDYGYCFYYTRKLDGMPVTYTDVPGGSTEADVETEPWSYEILEVLVSEDGMEEFYLMNQYDIGEVKVKNLELLPFSEIIEIYEKMMVVQNADVLTDKGDENLTEYPVKERTYHTDRIVLGYARIYDPQADGQTGLLVPVWDFFGENAMDYGSGMETVRNQTSFLTINAVDGTIINRWLGY